MSIMEYYLLISPVLRENPHQEIPETAGERRRTYRVPAHYNAESHPEKRECGLKDQRYQHSPSNLYQLIARERTGITVNSHVSDHVTRTYIKLKVERYINHGTVFSNSSKLPSESAMSLSTVALTTIVSATVRHISSDTDKHAIAIPRRLREWNLSDSRSAAAGAGWEKGKHLHLHTCLRVWCYYEPILQAVILACPGMMFSGL
jgi:hypothetical protein